MTARAYTTPDEFRSKPFGIPLRQYTDEQIQDYIEIATANVEAFCERIFSETKYTEVFRGDDTATHLLYEYPIVSITSLSQSTIGTSPTTTAYDVTNRLIRSDRNLAVGRLELDGFGEFSVFSSGSIYTAIYDSGLVVIPATVRHATALWVSELIKPDFGGISADVPEIVPFTSQQISELLIPLRRRRISGV